LTDGEALTAYNCFKDTLRSGYAKSGLTSDMGPAIATDYQGWSR
jgi:hypothetical protein